MQSFVRTHVIKKIIILYILSFGTMLCHAADNSMMEISVGTRPTAMGQAYTALAEGVQGVFWNPAGVGYTKGLQTYFMHNQWLQDATAEYVAAVYPVGPGIAGLACAFMQFGDFEAYDEFEQPIDSYRVMEGFVTASYGWVFYPNLSGGASLKMPFSIIADDNDFGINADLGLSYILSGIPRMRFGAVFANFLSMGTVGSVAETRLGMAFQEKSGLQASLDADYRLEPSQWSLRMGLEYTWRKWLALRLGHTIPMAETDLPGYGLSAGLGFVFQIQPLAFEVGYAFAPYGDLGQTHRIDITVDVLPQIKELQKKRTRSNKRKKK